MYDLNVLGKSVCTVITLANWNWFKEWEHNRVLKRGPRYENLKNTLADKMWQQVLTLYPQLKDKVCCPLLKLLTFLQSLIMIV